MRIMIYHKYIYHEQDDNDDGDDGKGWLSEIMRVVVSMIDDIK